MSHAVIGQVLSNGLFLAFVAGIPLVGLCARVNVYDAFISGAKEGFEIGVRLIPYLIAMIVAIGMFRAAGGFELLGQLLQPILSLLHVPHEVLPLAAMRPFSGSASNGMLAEIISHYGADSLIAKTAATMMGSTETTFYVVAVYFGAVGVRRTRHAIPAGLIADLVGVLAAVWICRFVFGSAL